MKVIVAGGRLFEDYDFVKAWLQYLFQNLKNLEIVEGGAPGADFAAKLYAKDNGILCTEFKADWLKYEKAAGPIRNQQMAEYADALVAFWDGQSRGTRDMIDRAQKLRLKIKIIRIDEHQLPPTK